MAQYIDKSAVVAEIQRRIDDLLKSNQNPGGPIFCFAREMLIEEYKNILSFLDTLEVKEIESKKQQDIELPDFDESQGTSFKRKDYAT